MRHTLRFRFELAVVSLLSLSGSALASSVYLNGVKIDGVL